MTDPVFVCSKCRNGTIVDARTPGLPPVSYDLLRSNQLPSRTETQQERLYLEQEEHELRRYDSEILRLQKALEGLETQRRHLSERMQCRSSWLAPIRRLPAEVLLEILALVCLPLSLDICHWTEKSATKAQALVLSHVSYHWRLAARGSVRLWSRICIDTDYLAKIQIEPLLELYLANSGGLLSSFKFASTLEKHDSKSLGPCLSVINKVSPHLERLESFIYRVDDRTGGLFESMQPKGSHLTLPSLRYFESRRSDWRSPTVWFRHALLGASELTKVHSYNLIDEGLLPYHQLTTLTISHVDNCRDLAVTLRHCISLQSLKVTIHGQDDSGLRISPDMPASVTLPRLDHLDVSTLISKPAVTFFLGQLTIPLLTSASLFVSLPYKPATHEPHLRSFADLIRRSGCQLNVFTLGSYGYFNPSRDELRDFLGQCPKLSRLSMYAAGALVAEQKTNSQTITYRLFEALEASPEFSLVAPNLVKMTIGEDRAALDPNFAFAMLDVIESRNACRNDDRAVCWDFDITFRELYSCSAEIIEEFDSRLAEIAEDGVKCSIKWAKPLNERDEIWY